MIARSLGIAALLWLCAAATVSADDATPPPATVPVPVSTDIPATAPPVSTLPPATEPPLVEPTAPPVAPERSTPVASVNNSGPAVATAQSESAPPSSRPVLIQPQPTLGAGSSSVSSGNAAAVPTAPPDVPPSVPPDVTLPSAPPDGSSNLDLTAEPASAQAPAQLTCSPKRHPVAPPFLSSPYPGWTELVSFVDHDQPDYAVDGTIVLANGLTARASDGQASDLFPAYWSPSLRQYINYDGHNGYDFDISYQPVLAAAGGTVEYAGWNDPNPYVGYGQMVLINHHNGYVTLYGHLSKLEVSTGDKVSGGQEIGISGTTGHSSGPHLHFTVFHDCQVADPYGWTGHGKDPLASFSGSPSGYLWLPSRDPLLLNPPPNWPSYPAGLQLSFGNAGSPNSAGTRQVPPVDRLLLLALPSGDAVPALDSATALARTEAAITGEAQQLEPELDALRAERLINAFQVIPSAAAIWVHGTASSAQLEGLPGVASLSGVQPHDLLAAETGLAHAVLAQMGRQQAPALWPSGFRAGLHAWRPVATVLSGQALVAGLALPGKRVVVSLQRGSTVRAAAITSADPSTGGFVAFIHDGSGNLVRIRAADRVRVTCAGRTTEVTVQAIRVEARARSIHGVTAPGATVSLSILPSGSAMHTSVTSAGQSGAYGLNLASRAPAGTQVVAGLKDAAGNEQGAASFVPGIALTEDSSVLRGWTVGHAPRVVVRRAGHAVIDTALHPSADGSFLLRLGGSQQPFTLRPGDSIIIGSRLHHRTIAVPILSLDQGSHGTVTLRGPSGTRERVQLITAGGASWQRNAAVSSSRRVSVSFPVRSIRAGDRVSAELLTATGDSVSAIREPLKTLLLEGTPLVRGAAAPGQVLTLVIRDDAGKVRAEAAAIADESTGRFQAVMRDPAGLPVRVGRGSGLTITTDGTSQTFSFPRLRLIAPPRVHAVTIMAPPGTVLRVRIARTSRVEQQTIRIDATGREILSLASPGEQTKSVSVTWNGPSGLAVQRLIRVGTGR